MSEDGVRSVTTSLVSEWISARSVPNQAIAKRSPITLPHFPRLARDEINGGRVTAVPQQFPPFVLLDGAHFQGLLPLVPGLFGLFALGLVHVLAAPEDVPLEVGVAKVHEGQIVGGAGPTILRGLVGPERVAPAATEFVGRRGFAVGFDDVDFAGVRGEVDLGFAEADFFHGFGAVVVLGLVGLELDVDAGLVGLEGAVAEVDHGFVGFGLGLGLES